MQIVQGTDMGSAQAEDPVMEGNDGAGQKGINHAGSDVDNGIQLA